MNALLVEILRLSVWLLLLCAVFVPLERLAGIKRQAFFRPQFLADLGYYAINSIFVGLILGTPLVLLGGAVHQYLPSAMHNSIAAWPSGLRLAASLLVGEIGFYWGHRLTHQIPLLWRFHAIHHSAKEIDFLTNTRAHPVDMVFARTLGVIPVLALGLTGDSTTVTALFLVLGTLWGFFIHANVRWRFGLLERVIATPFFHRWHHTNDERRDNNYAAMLPFVDYLFGTYQSPDHWPAGYGIDAPMPASLAGQLLEPFMPVAAPMTSLDDHGSQRGGPAG
ncbi:sterol desaturase family protein [Rhodanobacter sp. AS-Z3]|uniref:sterol desaturase family protein n=1 Tax=Rhodanobacter sp. AS-Z3 TaxID=3031330 RepID=UPI00247A1BA1|nr:sterol desaturase family protein [Rhodanobacter sp. AS-Z3]WEN16197.1 sterol desaturase family protein [Rhodanobacter sp. AS-Z3]